VAVLHILRVFVGEDGSHGNPLGVFLDGGEVPSGERLRVAAELGFSETVFVDDAARGEVAIYTPATELQFAGHPLVGTSWLLARQREPVDVLRPPAGEVATWVEGELAWVRGRPEWAAPFEHLELGSPGEVDALAGAPEGRDMAAVWAWEDESAGRLRARVFPIGIGIEEDEATGAAALKLAAKIGRAVEIHQGQGSVIHARPGPDGSAEIGGRAVLDDVREL
jgi:predicted PhzF superfamily epimerase YddE/YHI9